MTEMSIRIGRNLARIRKAQKVRQNALEDQIGAKIGSVSRWENGLTTPHAKFLYAMSKALGCSIDDFFAEEES